MHLDGNWIWLAADAGQGYNQSAEFRRDFNLKTVEAGKIAISADSFYRLKINGQWVNDGPSRSYPSHYQYDVIDITRFLRSGVNTVEATVRYFGCGTFHQMPRRAGFIANLLVHQLDGTTVQCCTDATWQGRNLRELIANTAKVSVQQTPVEVYDASVPAAEWGPVEALYAVNDGPWTHLEERDCRLLSRIPVQLKRFVSAHRENLDRLEISWQARRVYRPGSTSDNISDSYPTAIAFTVAPAKALKVPFALDNLRLLVNGVEATGNCVDLPAGKSFLVGVIRDTGTHPKDHTLILDAPLAELKAAHPYSGNSDEYALAIAPEMVVEAPDIPFLWANKELEAQKNRVFAWADELKSHAATPAQFQTWAAANLWTLTRGDLNADDGYWNALLRDPAPLHAGDVTSPGALLYRDGEPTLIRAVPAGTGIELIYDLGEQNCGYWELELDAAAGTIVDVYAVEFITPEGVIQHVRDHRNVLRYICHEGHNHYVSLKRRSGRYLFLTVSNAARDVKFEYLGLVESTYPVQAIGEFHSSDPMLDQVWRMSALTLKLCMEDTFTDCPLYEQTLWVGDARSEALFAFPVFGAYDLARRCIRITGRSLEHYPIVGCQVPSSWDCLLPAWSFMWGISVWDYYFETADREFVREVWPEVVQNLSGARSMIDPATGLFSMPGWNMFDWSPTDSCHETVMYLSMFFVGALDAALKLADAIGENSFTAEYAPVRKALADAIDRWWDTTRKQWPDYVEEGVAATQGAVHTSMLALLYDLTNAANQAAVQENVLTPRPDLYGVCSPFASLYYYMALEKLGADARIIDAIRRDYREMCKLNESTVWETYLSLDPAFGFPTRSHCHGWSSAPLYFLPRTTLGARMVKPGAAEFVISPVLDDKLTYASGRIATIQGALEVNWERTGDTLSIRVHAPAGVVTRYEANPSHEGLKIDFKN